MDNNQLLPFERNRYYVGKLLTSADFQTEQTYGMNKRRFLNSMMFGSGIVCGLNVYSLDDLSVMVDSGVAVDAAGMEIVLAEPLVRKLSAIEGFEKLESQEAMLCLAYQEEAVHPVYTVRGQESGESYESNHMREGCRIFLMDADKVVTSALPDPEFYATSVLYEDDDYRITCTMPAKCPCNSLVKLDVEVRRLRKDAEALTFKALIRTPAFTDDNNSHGLSLELQEVLLPENLDSQVLHFYLRSQSSVAVESVLLVDAQSIEVKVGKEVRTSSAKFALRTAVVDVSKEQLINQAVAFAGLDLRKAHAGSEYVALAQVHLQRTRNAYLIEGISDYSVRNYIETTAGSAQRRELESWFGGVGHTDGSNAGAVEPVSEIPSYPKPMFTTGTCDIALKVNMRKGQIAYSDEIIHGLGPGNVYVMVGTEYLSKDVKLGTTARNTIYGDAAFFPEESYGVATQTAVKVMNDRGSFVIAARLTADSNQVVLPLRWIAVLLPDGANESRLQKLAGKSIAATQPTIVMATRETHYVNVRFNNMEPCTLTYKLTEKNSGEITSDGIYTAPGREGVFEIRISCAEYPLITTYAYAVVKKKDVTQEED